MAKVRTREPFRGQGVMRFEIPEDSLPSDHRARLLWRVVEMLDLSAFTADAKALEGVEGRPLTSVRLLLTLWLYAISIGINSARRIARLTTSDDAFRWLVGDLRVSHDTLATFRVAHGPALDKLFTDVLAVLLHKGLLSLDLVAQDGTRVRASASAPSFRREASLEECREQAALHLKAVLAEQDDPEATEAEKQARLAAALDYQRRVDEAIVTVKDLRDGPKRKKNSNEPRASTTDAQARVMKMADGGFRPAYNIQMASAGSPLGGPRTIVAVQVTNVGSDMGSVTPMLAQIEARTGELPEKLLADANHANHDCIRRCAELGVEAFIPVPSRSQNPGANADHDPAVAAWRERMATDEAKQVYRARASLCELPNAHLKQHQGLAQVLVRGLGNVMCVAMLAALSANLVQHAARLLA
jgi:transposase